MSRKQLALLGLLLLVLGGIAGWIYTGGNNAWKQADTQAGAKVLAGLTLNDIASIRIAGAKDSVTLERKGAAWTVKERAGYPADAQKIGPLLVKLAELKVTQTDTISEALRPRLQLAAPGSADGGTGLDLLDAAGKPLGKLIIGKAITKKSDIPGATKDVATGRYLIKLDAPTNAIAVNDPLNEVEPNPVAWVDKTFIKPERVKSVASATTTQVNWDVTRSEEAEMAWQWGDAAKKEELDVSKAQDLARVIAGITMVDVVADPKPGELGLDSGTTDLAVQTFDGLRYVLTVGKKDGENRAVKLAVVGSPAPAGERAPGKDEKAEDKAKLDKEFKDKATANQARIAHELAMNQKVFLVTDASIAPLLKDRTALLKQKQASAQPDVPGLSQFEKKAPPKAAEKAPAKK